MNARAYIGLFLLGMFVVGITSFFQAVPGYMDADYYYATGRQLALGRGFWEPFLWNYLDDPAGLPHPGNTYWMPLGTILAAAGMWLSSIANFGGARLGFLLAAASLPPLAAALSARLSARRDLALLSGILAVFPGFYLVYLPTTDTFGLYAALGALWLMTAWAQRGSGRGAGRWQAGVLGLVSGLMHLARADGGLWLGLGVVWWALFRQRQSARQSGFTPVVRHDWIALAFLLAGYFLVMGPWVARNLAVSGAPLSPGAARVLWITGYDELYAYPAADLTFLHWWGVGFGSLQARFNALGANLQTALAVQGQIFLAPLVLAGAWRLRSDRRVQLGMLAWGATGLVMTLVFPFQGARGGFFHSGAAIQPFFWALATVGLQAAIELGTCWRGWLPAQARAVLGGGLALLAIFSTAVISLPRLEGNAWGGSAQVYQKLEQILQTYGAHAGEAVLVNNPAGYFAVNGRPALAIPNGDAAVASEVARRYGGIYLLLESNHPQALETLYGDPEDQFGWQYLHTAEGVHIFRLEPAGGEAGS